MNFIDLSDNELIEYCKNNNIQYLQKNKKLYKRKTLLSNINKYNMELSKKEHDIKDEKKEEINEVKEINEIIWTLEKNKDINIKYNEIKTNLHNIIKRCHQLLYSSNSIVGMKAQNDIMKLLTLKILQPQFANKDSDLYKSCEKLLENEDYDDYMSYCLNLNNFNEIYNKKDSPLQVWKLFVNGFLSKILETLYDFNDSKFNFDDDKTFMDLIKIIDEIKIDDDFIDAFSTSYGDIHEAFREYSGGKGAKELGQFFTPRNLIHSIFHGCGLNDIIKTYDNPTIYDPCMGTGGLLTRAYSNGNILSNNIYGCETEKDTIKFGECSLLLTTKCFNSNIERCDSLSKNPFIFTNKFDIIFTNPPFGTKMNYNDELEPKFNDFKDDKENILFDKIGKFDKTINFKTIYPIKSNNGACLFIQHCIYMLNDNGICAIVLPDGELFTGKSFKKFREYLCENVNILKIINVESGTFEHTSIKTSVIIFKKNGPTKNIEYLKINKDCNEVIKSAIVNINNIKKENYDFNLSKYIKKEKQGPIKYEIKILDDLCDISYGKFNSNDMNNNGDIPFYSCKNNNPVGFHDKYSFNYDNEYLLLITAGGNINNIIGDNIGLGKCYIVSGKTACRAGVCCLNLKPNINVNIRYIYNYLNINRLETNKKAKFTTNLGIISSDDIKKLEIPIPPLKVQEKIINDVEKLIKSIETIKLRNEQLKDEGTLFMEYYKKSELESLFKEAEIKTLGNICEINQGNPLIKTNFINGDYDVIGGGKIIGKHNTYNRDGNEIVLTRVGDINLNYINNKYYLTDNAFSIKSSNNITTKYIYYLLYYNNYLNDLYIGVAQKVISKTSLNNLEIPIPSLEIQEKIIKSYIDIEETYKNKYKKIEEDNNNHIDFLNELIKNIFNQ